MEKPIVVAITGEAESREAVRLAICAARVLRSPLVIAGVAVDVPMVPVAPMTGWINVPHDPQWLTEVVDRQLRTVALSIPDDVPVSTDAFVAPTVAAGVEALAERHDAQAVVLGATHHRLLTRALEGDHALGILRESPCPVLIAAADPAHAITATAPKRIGVAWDSSDEGTAALEVAVRVARLAGGRVHVVHALPAVMPLVLPPADPKMGRELTTARHHEAEREIRAAVAELDPELEIELDLRDGPRQPEIEAATKDLDVLIIGSSSKGAVRRVTVGSISEHLVHHNHCPVVVVPRGVAVRTRA